MKVFYHSADLDGHCSGAIVKYFYSECEMFGINYGQEFPWNKIKEGEHIFVVDFCLQPFDQMEKLNSICKLTWIDHHKSNSIDEAEKRNFKATNGQKLEIGKAGCELTWELLSNNLEVPRAIYLLGRYDVWDHSDPEVLPFQYGMRQFSDTTPNNQDFWKNLFEDEDAYIEILSTGKTILNYETSQNLKYCSAYAFETELVVDSKFYKSICVNKGFTNSQLFNSVWNPDKYDLMITFVRLKYPAEKWTVSLYSTKEEVDCGAIAKFFDGGGHKGAAGFQTRTLPFEF